jgi:hypothetical protein
MKIFLLNLLIYLILCQYSIAESSTGNAIDDDDRPALRTTRDIGENFVLNELKKSSKNYFDEVNKYNK